MSKKIPVEQEGLKVKVDFGTVWAFMWRFYVIVFAVVLLFTLLAGGF